ncbi:hypothetical protein HF313_06535 [Massilia atriviolacea]|uniref:Uncharacterized protein n=1 Tax=Massilia atriviolacea TaxID=2495579 RepID=A0A430HCW1_9BURK|nr:hypothetical protein [Massilia atriviolacea]RSZ55340.1 hypothetical protein EJB06_30155 [Massilia atriviolacea]
MLTIADLETLARTRLREATALFIAKEYSGSAYLSGYAVELTLKGKICMVLNWEGFPETRSEFNGLQSFKIHDLEILAFLAGLTHVLGTKYVQAWSDVTGWSPDDRYRRPGSLNAAYAKKMLAAASLLVSRL